jgi:periplasmic protein TonB
VKRFLLAAVLALTIHGLFFGFGPKLSSNIIPAKPRQLTFTFALRSGPDSGPGPELDEPAPSLDEKVTPPEKKEEKPVFRQETPKEIPTKVPLDAKTDVRPQKVEVKSPQKRLTQKKKERSLKRPPVNAQPQPEERPPSEATPEAAAAISGTTSVAPSEERKGEFMGPQSNAPGPIATISTAAEEKETSLLSAGETRKATPAYRKNPRPDYPRIAQRRGYEGTVLLEVLVTSAGKVEDLRIAESSGYPVLDRSAIKSVKKWLFEPGTIDDQKVDMWIRVPVRFELNQQ